jgi:hypothetical protein
MTDMITYELTPEDLTFYTDKTNEIKAGGFSINSSLLKNHIEQVSTGGNKNKNKQKSKINLDNTETKVSEKFDNMIIPAGLLFLQQNTNHGNMSDYGAIEVCEMNDTIPEDLYSKLLSLAEIKEINKKMTRNKKHKIKKNKKTRRVTK